MRRTDDPPALGFGAASPPDKRTGDGGGLAVKRRTLSHNTKIPYVLDLFHCRPARWPGLQQGKARLWPVGCPVASRPAKRTEARRAETCATLSRVRWDRASSGAGTSG